MTTQQRISDALKKAADTRVFEMGSGILSRTGAIFKELFPERSAVIIADCNTWKTAGQAVLGQLTSSGVECGAFIFPDREFHADWAHLQQVESVLRSSGAVAVSVGSGTINDLCKLSSQHLGQSYLSVATAASVDGYSSFGASITFEGLKQTFECRAPIGIIADLDVIAKAPRDMTAAGYADLAAKIPCGAEWMIADLFGTEPILDAPWHMLQDVLDEILQKAEDIADGNPQAIGQLFMGLTLSGFAMQAARSSRPASCTDHLFSHYLDMTGHRYRGKLQSHGFQVAVGTLTMCALFDEFLKMDLSGLDVEACVKNWPSLEQEQRRALDIFKDFVNPRLGYEEITKKYSDPGQVRIQLQKVRDNWPELREKYRSQVYPFERMKRLFGIVGAPCCPEDIGLTREKLREMMPFVQLMRYRINLLDLAKRSGTFDTLVQRVFSKGGAWDCSL